MNGKARLEDDRTNFLRSTKLGKGETINSNNNRKTRFIGSDDDRRTLSAESGSINEWEGTMKDQQLRNIKK
jgi:hypothetical protein